MKLNIKIPPYDSRFLNDKERQELLDVARRYLDVRWLHMGRNAKGLDCAGLLIVTVNDYFGCQIEISGYPRFPNERVMREICGSAMVPIKREDMRPGDVILMYVHGFGVVHLGWYAGNTLIHASTPMGKVVETTIHPDWYFRRAYVVPRFIGD